MLADGSERDGGIPEGEDVDEEKDNAGDNGGDRGGDVDVDRELVGEVLGSIESVEDKKLRNTRLLALLVDGERSVSGLVDYIYGRKSRQPGYRKLYMRVSRRLAVLEEKGLVSRAIFGRERPYRITRVGRITLSSALPLEREAKDVTETEPWTRWHSIVIVVTALSLVLVLLSPPHPLLLWVLFFLIGCSVTLAVLAIREVI